MMNVKKHHSHKYDGELKVVVATPALKSHKYVYVNGHVYTVDSNRKIVAIVN